MVRNKSENIIDESIKRQVDQIVDDIVLEELPTGCPIQSIFTPEQLRKMLALSIVIMRITMLSSWN